MAEPAVHLLVNSYSTDVRCGEEFAQRITSNPHAVTCARCALEPGLPEPDLEPPVDDVVVDDIVDDDQAEREVDVPFLIRTPTDLRFWRARHKISLRRLAKTTGVHWTTLHRWEMGTQPIPRLAELALNYLERDATV